MAKLIPLDERLRKTRETGLAVLSQSLAVYHQGVAALTRMRCHRENLSCWPHWEKEHYEEQYKNIRFSPSRKDIKMNFWFRWGGLDILYENEIDLFQKLVLEPMYWLETCANAQEGA